MARAMDSPGKSAHHLLAAVAQLEPVQKTLGASCPCLRVKAEISPVKQQNLTRRQGKIEVRALRNHANQAFYLDLFFPDIVLANPGRAPRWSYPRSENSYSR
jgi:hypothetical protein